MENKRRRRRKIDNKKKLILILDGVLLAGLIVAAVVLVTTLTKDGGGQAASANAAKPANSTAVNALAAADGAIGVSVANAPAKGNAVEGGSADAKRVDFTVLANEGVPAVAYIASEGTPIEYPVVQHIDNEYYMARNVAGKKDENGAIYLDCRNSKEFLDEQVVIYGNPMADGTMFGSLVSYSDNAYLTEHPSLYLYTPAANYRIDVFAAHTASPAMTNYPIWFENIE